MKKFDIAIIGGDRRTACMAQVFQEKGLRTISYGTVTLPKSPPACRADSLQDAVSASHILVFGIPFQKNDYLFFQESMPLVSLAELKRCLRKHHHIFGGIIPETFRHHCETREISCYDFMTDESLTIFNAIATAEGAIAEALLHKDTNLHHSRCLVLGYGRCGKVLADKLRGLSARVTVCSRNLQELSLADSLGMDTLALSALRPEIRHFEYIFNTIPSKILTEDCLQCLSPGTLIIDIASGAGGVNLDAAARHDISVLHCPGLPGKYAGYSSARRLAEYVLEKAAPCA